MNAMRIVTLIQRFLLPAMMLLNGTVAIAAPRPVEISTGVPKLLWVVTSEHSTSAAADAQGLDLRELYRSAALPAGFLSLQPVTGKAGERVRLFGFESFAHFEKLRDSIERGLSSLERQIPAQSRSSAVGMYRPDLSYRPDSIDFAKVRYIELTSFLVNPGNQHKFIMARRIQVAAHVEANTTEEAWATYQMAGGTSVPRYLIVLPMRELAEMDKGPQLHGATFEEALERHDGEAMRRHDADSVVSITGQLYKVDPNSSHVSDAFAAEDPAFWTGGATAR